MPGKQKDTRSTNQQEEIARLKADYLAFFIKFPVQQAAADFIGRTPACIQDWQQADPVFFASVTRAKAEWAEKNHRKIKPDNLLARLYEDLRPPKQEVEQTGETTVTITYVNPPDPDRTDPQTTPDLGEAPRQNDD